MSSKVYELACGNIYIIQKSKYYYNILIELILTK